MRHLRGVAMGVAASLTLFSGAVFSQGAADAFPTRPVVVIITSGAAGSVDIETRRYTPKLAEFLGQPFVIDFKTGAGGTIGNTYVARAAPDGHTLLAATPNFTASACAATAVSAMNAPATRPPKSFFMILVP